MTICIALACSTGIVDTARIVVCVDGLSSSDVGSVEFVQKDRTIGRGWRCLTAGATGDINSVLPLLRVQFKAASVIDETNVQSLVEKALAERKRQKASEVTIGRWGFTYEEFLQRKAQFPESDFSKTLEEIKNIELSLQLLIVGFLSDNLPMIVRVFGSIVEIEDNFAVVGSGGTLAHASLEHRNHLASHDLLLGLYHAYEAKRHAQRNRLVGTYTHIAYLKANAPPRVLLEIGKQYLEAQFKELGPKELGGAWQMPPDAVITKSGHTFSDLSDDDGPEVSPAPSSEGSS